MTTEMTQYQAHMPANVYLEDYAMDVTRIVGQVRLIQEVMHTVMKDGEHYGKIPGCGDKPSLLKPGAEKLSVTFRLVPEYKIIKSELPGGHREYELTCNLMHAPTGTFCGSGVGSCTTMESKYRYRVGDGTPTGKPVPKAYWKDRDINLIGGRGFKPKKVDGKWEIYEQGDKVEHDNPADYYNTVMKMAKKRAHVDAILTATAASDIFTQDIEDYATPEPAATAPEPTVPPPAPVPNKFDELATNSRVPADQMAAFVTATAAANKTTEDAIKDRASKNWAGFLSAFEKWSAPPVTGAKNAPDETIECPNSVEPVPASKCPDCAMLTGCPAHEAAA